MQRLTDLVHSDSNRSRKSVTALVNYDATCMKEGYLQKKGQRLKGWKRRWFVCDGVRLSYYISRKDRKPNAVIPLESCSVEDGGLSETWNSPRIYLTDGTTGVMYCLSAEDGETVTLWLNVLRTAVIRAITGTGTDTDMDTRQLQAQQVASPNAVTRQSRAAPRSGPKPSVGGGLQRSERPTGAATNGVSSTSSAVARGPTSGGGAPTGSTSTGPGTAGTTASSSGGGKTMTTTTSYGDDDEVTPQKLSLGGSDATPPPPERRTGRLTSASIHTHARAHTHRSKSQHHATSVTLENELASGLDMLEMLLAANTNSHRAGVDRPHGRGGNTMGVRFRPIGATNGVLKSVGSVDGHSPSGRPRALYARASAVLPVPSEVAAVYLTDHGKRAEWDIDFPCSTQVASFDECTELIHLHSDGFRQIETTRPFVAPQIAAAVGSLIGGLTASSWETVLVSAIVAGLVAAVLNSVEYSAICEPRDLVLVRHVRESNQVKRGESFSDILDDEEEDEDEDAQSVVLVLEKSVTNELKPVVSGLVRAHVQLSGWLLEPVEGGRTRATYVTNLDARGWVSPDTKAHFLVKRLACVSVLLEHVIQSQLCGAEAAHYDDRVSIDENAKDEDEAMDFMDDSYQSEDSSYGSGATSSSTFHPSVYMKGMKQIPSGGLKLVDKEIAKKQGGVLKDVIKSAGAKMLEGKGTVSLSLPVRIFEPRTNLERVVDLFLFGPTFLNNAADQTDPVERFKMVMAFAVAGMHHGAGQLKPFNPILGETLQTALNDGTEVCCEHTSHHPPVSNFQLQGKKYSISGYIWWHGSFSMKSNAVVQNNRGPIRVGFSDGTVISYSLPIMQSGGFLWGDRTIELLGSVTFEDRKNHLCCELKFNPDEKKGMGGMFSTPKTPSDQVRGVVINTATGAEVCDVSGSWLENLRFNDKAYWSYGRERSGYTVHLPDSAVLASDSRFREDLQSLAANDLDAAQDWKVRLEVLQRADRKVRTEGRRPNHWSFREDKAGH